MNSIFRSVVAFILASALLLPSGTAYMANEPIKGRNIKVREDGYTFEMKEIKGLDKGIIRIHKNDKKAGKKTEKGVKKLLSATGMEEKHINKLSNKELQEYANADTIITSVSYSKINETGEITYLDEKTALEEVAVVNKMQEINRVNQMNGIATASIDVNMDSYMKVTYSVGINGENCYSYVIGEWLVMPFFRGYDSIGACAKYITVTPGTPECSITYDCTTTYSNGVVSTKEKSIKPSKIKTASKSGWMGAAAVFSLPLDALDGKNSIINSNLTAIFKYYGKIELPDQKLNFNAIGTYSHATVGISFGVPGVSIGTSGTSASIGLSGALLQDKRNVLLEIQYTP